MAYSHCLLRFHPFTNPYNLNLPPLSFSSKSFKPICSIPPHLHREILAVLSASTSLSLSNLSPSPPQNLPSEFTTEQLLHAIHLQNDETSVLDLFNWAFKQPSFKPTLSIYKKIIQKLGQLGSFESMKQILEYMRLSNYWPNEGTFLIFIESYVKHDLYGDAIGVLGMMEQAFGLKPTSHLCDFLFKVLVDGKKFKLVESVHSMMFTRGVKPEACYFGGRRYVQVWFGTGCDNLTTIREGYINEGNLESALRIKEELIAAQCPLYQKTVNVLIHGYCKEGRIEEALNFAQEMWAEGFRPNQFVLDCLVHGLCKSGKLNHALELFDLMLQEGFNPHILTYNTCISRLCKSGQFDEAMKILNQMILRDSPNRVTYNILIVTLCEENKMEQAFEVACIMTDLGILPDVRTFSSLIRGLGLSKNHDLAIDLFHGMKITGCRPNEYTYNILINSLCFSGKLDRVLGILKDMESSGCPRDVVTYSTLISGFIKNKRIEEAEESLDQMILEGLQPNNIAYNSMLRHYCRVGDIKKAADILQTMASNGCEPDVITYRALIEGLCNVGRIEIAIRLLITIQAKGMPLAPQTYNPLLRALFKQKKTKTAMRLFSEMKEKGDPPDAFSYETIFSGLCSGRGPIEEAVKFVLEMTDKRLIPKFSTFCMLAERLCALSMEDTLVMLIKRIMDSYFFSKNEASMIMGFMKIRKFQDALATLGRILNRRNPKRGYSRRL